VDNVSLSAHSPPDAFISSDLLWRDHDFSLSFRTVILCAKRASLCAFRLDWILKRDIWSEARRGGVENSPKGSKWCGGLAFYERSNRRVRPQISSKKKTCVIDEGQISANASMVKKNVLPAGIEKWRVKSRNFKLKYIFFPLAEFHTEKRGEQRRNGRNLRSNKAFIVQRGEKAGESLVIIRRKRCFELLKTQFAFKKITRGNKWIIHQRNQLEKGGKTNKF